ncbi:MAG: hypothetical protein RSD27_09635 [Ruthenibacterium sp.]
MNGCKYFKGACENCTLPWCPDEPPEGDTRKAPEKKYSAFDKRENLPDSPCTQRGFNLANYTVPGKDWKKYRY